MSLKTAKSLEDLKKAKHEYFQGELKHLQDQIKKAQPSERATLGQRLTALKDAFELEYNAKLVEIEKASVQGRLDAERIDVTYPHVSHASLHPLSIIALRLRSWFLQHGYAEVSGTEIETDHFNFEQLNIPKDHPSRDAQDTLYLSEELLLRTHNTGFTARELAQHKNTAFAAFAIGKVYRNDETDQTHTHQFTQLDLVHVGNNLSLPNLVWTLTELLSYVFEQKVKLRLRPSYFPFTEPSVEVDVFYNNRWIEVLGSGMLNKIVLEKAGYTNSMNAFAAGIGLERLAMIKYGVTDIREFYKNDLRFLNQFKGGR